MNDVEKLKSLASSLFDFESEEEELGHKASMKSLEFLKGVKAYLKENNISQKEFAEILGNSKSYITQLFTGDRLLNMKLICRIEKALGVELVASLKIVDKSATSTAVSGQRYTMLTPIRGKTFVDIPYLSKAQTIGKSNYGTASKMIRYGT